MKTLQLAGVQRIVIEHAKGRQTLQVKGTCRVETFENGTVEVRAFIDPAQAGAAQGAPPGGAVDAPVAPKPGASS